VRVAIVGIRGLPPSYGGYETFADHFVSYFIDAGHEVVVACERPISGTLHSNYRGAELRYFPSRPPKKYSLRKIYEGLNDLYFYLYLARDCDVMYILAGLGTQILPLVRLLNPRIRVVTNNDGIEWNREKYNRIEKILWKSFIRSSLRSSDMVIFDNPRLAEFFPRHNPRKAVTIEYGVEPFEKIHWDEDILLSNPQTQPLVGKILPDEYYVVVARLQEDNNTHEIIQGYLDSKITKPLVVIGEPLEKRYQVRLENLIFGIHEKSVFLIGGIYDQFILNMIRSNSRAYIHGHSAGGTNPSLLEAMSMGRAVLAHNNPFNFHVLRGNGLFFNNYEELSSQLNMVESDSNYRKGLGEKNLSTVLSSYTWGNCMEKHERAFELLINRSL